MELREIYTKFCQIRSNALNGRDDCLRTIGKALCLCILLILLHNPCDAAGNVYKQGDTQPEIVAVKRQLQQKGYDVGTPDDFFSWRFAQAVKAYQRHEGLKTDGVIDGITYRRIMGRPFPVHKPASHAISVIDTAKRFIGVPYVFGGTTPRGFDCSGFVQYVFNQYGKKLPRTADIQFKQGKHVARNQLTPGDLVFFTTYEAGASHNGIYLGNGQFIHASSSRGVTINKLDDMYWKSRYFGARRIL